MELRFFVLRRPVRICDEATDDGSLLGAAGQRAWSGMTGTLPQHRGRGLARLAKHHALHAGDVGAGSLLRHERASVTERLVS